MEQQIGFVAGIGTANAVLFLRKLAERNRDVQKPLFICFVDYEKAIKHEGLLEILKNLMLEGKDLNITLANKKNTFFQYPIYVLLNLEPE